MYLNDEEQMAVRDKVINSDDYPFTFSQMLGVLLGLGALSEILSWIF